MCRPSGGECDLAEHCTGFSASCPANAFTQNGLSCNYGRGHCYNGQCPSHTQHCKRLWGPGNTTTSVKEKSGNLTLVLISCCTNNVNFDMSGLLRMLTSCITSGLDADVAADACFYNNKNCRRTPFGQRCSKQYVAFTNYTSAIAHCSSTAWAVDGII